MFDPKELHAFAVRCASGDPDEASCRAAISRAYYAAYLVAHEHVRNARLRIYPPPGEYWGSHERMINAVGIIRYPGAEAIKKDLLRLKRLRVNADYRLGYTEARRQMPIAIGDSARIIAWIDALP